MRTFCIATLGCKVNQYESEQIAALLRSRGLEQVESPQWADLRIVNSCSVTVQAASKSRQTVRQVVRLPVLGSSSKAPTLSSGHDPTGPTRQRIIVTGCWATSDQEQARQIPGVSAVITHHDDVAAELDQLITRWQSEDRTTPVQATATGLRRVANQGVANDELLPEPENEGWIIQAGTPTVQFTADNKSHSASTVKKNPGRKLRYFSDSSKIGTTRLPLLHEHQSTHQRGFLKIQDGCDAHCTYCIIPTLRPRIWSKPIEDVIIEAKNMVESGHQELVLTGIFLSAYGQTTALRHRQSPSYMPPLGHLIESLCTRVPNLRRLRLSSLEPGDLTDDLISILRSHPQVVPHFHLPLQSGSDLILRRMNRQYKRIDYLMMIEKVNTAFDRPALTTDIIVGFPGEADEEFNRTLEVVNESRFIHIHAFHFSPRPNTAASRWTTDFIHGPVINELRLNLLQNLASHHSLNFRRQFLGQVVEVLVERDPDAQSQIANQKSQIAPSHGRCTRYFDVHFDSPATPGDLVSVRIDSITPRRTFGTRTSQ